MKGSRARNRKLLTLDVAATYLGRYTHDVDDNDSINRFISNWLVH
jgi:hypothetical protein